LFLLKRQPVGPPTAESLPPAPSHFHGQQWIVQHRHRFLPAITALLSCYDVTENHVIVRHLAEGKQKMAVRLLSYLSSSTWQSLKNLMLLVLVMTSALSTSSAQGRINRSINQSMSYSYCRPGDLA